MNFQLSVPVEPLAPELETLALDITFILPAMNESQNIQECIRWCLQGLKAAGVSGEILIVDSSTDGTAELALEAGARVLRTPPRGLGQAYIDALPYARGRWMILGDCDCTYDFRELRPFVEAFASGSEFIMGSRFRGSIEKGAMPFLHQYFGTPLTTWILNRIFSSRFSDIHCGMRGITLEAFQRMKLISSSWEYASEMVIKSVLMGLRTTEVPVHFFRDRNGRVSLHRRLGFWSPWQAGWINLRAMFIFGADFFLTKPGIVFLAMGLLLILPMLDGPLKIGPITFSVFWMLLGVTLTLIGVQCLFLGALSRVFFDFSGRAAKAMAARYPYNRSMVASLLAAAGGGGLLLRLLKEYIGGGLVLNSIEDALYTHLGVFGILLVLWAFMNFVFTLMLHGFLASTHGKPGDPT
jgi:glycosyltransferase involved in cell wall biosynthesis